MVPERHPENVRHLFPDGEAREVAEPKPLHPARRGSGFA